MQNDAPKREEGILRFWKQTDAFKKSVSRRPKSRSFVFYEGPPTANGQPGIHHVLSRAYKDIICRYKTMQGYRVERKAGWDTHGLPVEVEVEKELGLRNKKDIEKYGLAKFNEKCRKSVWKYKQEWDKLTERVGFWVDLENPYITYDPKYMESLWWIIKQAHERKLLYEGYRVAPYCPRCGTSLSSHEVAQGYEEITEDSVFVKFTLSSDRVPRRMTGQIPQQTYLLAWTTTPWTLPGNVALAIGAKINYILAKQEEEYYILAKERLSILKDGYEIIKEFKGKDLVGLEYEPLFKIQELKSEKSYQVYAADFVNTEDGTGIVHTAVMYGEDDYNLGEKFGLPKIHTVDEAGKFNKLVPKFEGEFVKEADAKIIADLASRSVLYKKERYRHSYPFCWRCKSPLLYYAMQSWFMKMSSLRKELIRGNKTINWIPHHTKEGRFGEWLREVKDWNFSRSRYWGTPLPVWRCEACWKVELIGSRKDIAKQNFTSNKFFILRHGESEKNHKANPIISSCWPEVRKYHLTNRGRKQVQKSAELLKRKGGVDLIFASDFTRTKETAGIVAKELGLNVSYDKMLREYNLGVYDGLPERAFYEDFPDHKERFKKAPTRGETTAKVQQRMFDFMLRLNKKYENKKILIVSHGDPIWTLDSRLKGLSLEETIKIKETKIGYPQVGELRKIEFKHFPYNKEGDLDFHRPYVDEIKFTCPYCLASPDPAKRDKSEKSEMKRVPELIDVWFDSGAMPFASAFAKATADKQGRIKAPAPFPADYIAEAIDQTRGWFYSLLAISTLMGFGAPYKNAISLAHVLDKRGKKMSKSRGNVVDPQTMIDKYGADSLRWYFYTMNQPGDYKNFDEADLQKTYRKFISTLANTLEFYKTYKTRKTHKTNKAHSALDRWVLSRLNSVAGNVEKKLDNYDITGAARALEEFVIEDVSNWYVRRSRKKFQNSDSPEEKEQAEQTLEYVLLAISKLCAPFVPFLAEYVYQEMRARGKTSSVHWEDFPKLNPEITNHKMESNMKDARGIVELAHRARAKRGLRVRQPLLELRINLKLGEEIENIIAEEVNVKKVVYVASFRTMGVDWEAAKEGNAKILLCARVTAELKEEGFLNEFVRHVQSLRKAGGFVPRDKIVIRYEAQGMREIFSRMEAAIKKQNNAEEILGSGSKKEAFGARGEFEWEGKRVWVGIKKVKFIH